MKIVFLMTSCKKTGPTQQTLNIISNLDAEKFEAILITLYEETEESQIADFLPHVSKHYFVKTDKKSIMLGLDKELRKKLEELQPDVIHTVGVFPDYAVCRIGKYKQVHTLRNYVYDDYPKKFGKVRGYLLAKMQIVAMRKSDMTICCSESLSKIYHKNLHMDFRFIRNGVDTEKFKMPDIQEKKKIRMDIGLMRDAFVFIYTGQFIERKNVPFLLEGFVRQFGNKEKFFLFMLGAGVMLDECKSKYSSYSNIKFWGNVSNVNYFLKASDVYISTSKSEGLPNGVLEAMGTGLPVILSDIEQHKEIFEPDDHVGFLYQQGNMADFETKLSNICSTPGLAINMGKNAYMSVRENFSAAKMSREYQAIYETMEN